MAKDRSFLQRLLGHSPDEPLLADVRAGGGSFRAVVFTRNRRTMVSVGERGRTLRLHECFRTAPPQVLRAVGTLLSRRDAAARAGAREVVRAYLVERLSLPAERPPPRQPRRRSSADRPVLDRLQLEFDRVNTEHFAGSLPRVPIALSGRMRRRNGHFSSDPLEIVISRSLCTQARDGEAEKTMRHEMIHLWQFIEGRKPGHGADFRRLAARLGVHPRATREVGWK